MIHQRRGAEQQAQSPIQLAVNGRSRKILPPSFFPLAGPGYETPPSYSTLELASPFRPWSSAKTHSANSSMSTQPDQQLFFLLDNFPNPPPSPLSPSPSFARSFSPNPPLSPNRILPPQLPPPTIPLPPLPPVDDTTPRANRIFKKATAPPPIFTFPSSTPPGPPPPRPPRPTSPRELLDPIPPLPPLPSPVNKALPKLPIEAVVPKLIAARHASPPHYLYSPVSPQDEPPASISVSPPLRSTSLPQKLATATSFTPELSLDPPPAFKPLTIILPGLQTSPVITRRPSLASPRVEVTSDDGENSDIDLGASIESLAWKAGVMEVGQGGGMGLTSDDDDDNDQWFEHGRFERKTSRARELSETSNESSSPRRLLTPRQSSDFGSPRKRQSYKLVRKPSVAPLNFDSASSSDEESFDLMFDTPSGSGASTTATSVSPALSPYWLQSKRYHKSNSSRESTTSTPSPEATRSVSWNGSSAPTQKGWRNSAVSAPPEGPTSHSMTRSTSSSSTICSSASSSTLLSSSSSVVSIATTNSVVTPTKLGRPGLRRPSTPSALPHPSLPRPGTRTPPTPSNRRRTDTVSSSSTNFSSSSSSSLSPEEIPPTKLQLRPPTPAGRPARSSLSPSSIPTSTKKTSSRIPPPLPISRLPSNPNLKTPEPKKSSLPHPSSAASGPRSPGMRRPPSLSTLQYTGSRLPGQVRLELVERKSGIPSSSSPASGIAALRKQPSKIGMGVRSAS